MNFVSVSLFLGSFILSLFSCEKPRKPAQIPHVLSQPDSVRLADSCLRAATNLLYGDTWPKDSTLIFATLEKACMLKSGEACYVLGDEFLENGLRHRSQNKINTGIGYLQQAITLGDKSSYLRLAKHRFSQQEFTEAIHLLEQVTELGEPYGPYMLSCIYLNGSFCFEYKGIQNTALVNRAKGFDYLKKAAQMGNFEACISMGRYYLSGQDSLVPPNHEEAKRILRKALKIQEKEDILGSIDEIEFAITDYIPTDDWRKWLSE